MSSAIAGASPVEAARPAPALPLDAEVQQVPHRCNSSDIGVRQMHAEPFRQFDRELHPRE